MIIDINEWDFLSHYPKQSLHIFVHLFSSDNINATIPDELTFMWKMGKESLERINENPPFPWAWNCHWQILVIKSLDQNNYWCFACVCFHREGHCRRIQLKTTDARPPSSNHFFRSPFTSYFPVNVFLTNNRPSVNLCCALPWNLHRVPHRCPYTKGFHIVNTPLYGVVPKGLLTFLGSLYKEVAKTASGTLMYRLERQTGEKKFFLQKTLCPQLRKDNFISGTFR